MNSSTLTVLVLLYVCVFLFQFLQAYADYESVPTSQRLIYFLFAPITLLVYVIYHTINTVKCTIERNFKQ